jgi:hypothetical protein
VEDLASTRLTNGLRVQILVEFSLLLQNVACSDML